MPKRVLIAEDSSVIQNLTKKILQQLNYSIDTVKNGEAVLKKMDVEDYDIILMDINMPKMDGMECTKVIRTLENKTKAQIPIVAITGNAKNYTEIDFEEVGINEYLEKPINFDELVTVVKKYTE